MAKYPQEFLSDDFSHPHHRRSVTVLVVAIILFGGLLWAYISQPRTLETVQVLVPDPHAAERALVSQPNPPANLTQTEMTVAKKIIHAPNPRAQLTAQQMEERRALLTQ